MRAVLAQLSPEQRAVVELHLAGLTGPEIAVVMDRNPAAIRAAQSRATARLRVLLANEREEAGYGDR